MNDREPRTPDEALLAMAHDLFVHRYREPHDRITDCEVRCVEGCDWEAVIHFKSGGSITINFELVAPCGLAPAIRTTWLDSLRKVEAAIDRDVPSLGLAIH